MAIGNVSADDTLVGAVGSGGKQVDGSVHLVCAKGKHSHCGVHFMGTGLPVSVYNFEVYRRHVYRVGYNKLLVHNLCEKDINEIKSRISSGQWKRSSIKMKSGYTNVEFMDLTHGLDKNHEPNTLFRNLYHRDHWIMAYNYKNSSASYYMSDVVYEQARMVFGDGYIPKPRKITREFISNEDTVSVINRHMEDPRNRHNLLNEFMNHTVNGKSTQRILNLYGWKAERIDIPDYADLPSVDIYLS